MSTIEMVNAINNKSAELVAKENEKRQCILLKNQQYIEKAKSLIMKYSSDIMRVVNALQDNGFYLISKAEINVGRNASQWVTNGIRHNIGFVTTTPQYYYTGKINIVGFGIENGGYCGNIDLKFDFDGNMLEPGQVYSDGSMVTLYKFVDNFEKFVNDFYNYVETTYLKTA